MAEKMGNSTHLLIKKWKIFTTLDGEKKSNSTNEDDGDCSTYYFNFKLQFSGILQVISSDRQNNIFNLNFHCSYCRREEQEQRDTTSLPSAV